MTVNLASHESLEAKLAPTAERRASSNVLLSQQPQRARYTCEHFFSAKTFYFSLPDFLSFSLES